jgi:hypothetical protein
LRFSYSRPNMHRVSGWAYMQVASTNLSFRLKSSARAGLGHRLVAALIFAAFLLQGFVTQTHMHTGSSAIPTTIHFASKALHHAPTLPGSSDEANCPLCQAIVHAGAYIPPVVLDTLVRQRQSDTLPVVATRDARAAYYGYSEQPRGPPSL